MASANSQTHYKYLNIYLLTSITIFLTMFIKINPSGLVFKKKGVTGCKKILFKLIVKQYYVAQNNKTSQLK